MIGSTPQEHATDVFNEFIRRDMGLTVAFDAAVEAALARQREQIEKMVEGWHYKKGGYTELAAIIRESK